MVQNLLYPSSADWQCRGLRVNGLLGYRPSTYRRGISFRLSAPTPRLTSTARVHSAKRQGDLILVSRLTVTVLSSAIGPTWPFPGTGPAMNALLAGQIDYVCNPILGPMPHVRAGTEGMRKRLTDLGADVPEKAKATRPRSPRW